MDVRRCLLAALVAAAGATGAVAPPGLAGPFLPVGAGAWAGSPNVTQSGGCSGVTTGTTDCTISAESSYQVPPSGRTAETCRNATYVVTTPVVIGTDFGCHTRFAATVRLTGTGAGPSTGEYPEVTVETGACAGLTLVGPTVTVTDGAAGSYAVPVRVAVTSSGWKMQGHLVALDTSTTRVVVLDVVATVSPGCSAVRLRDGSVAVTFHGVFNGSYQFL